MVRQGAARNRASLVIENRLDGEIALPANLIRQVMLNLLLNACQAANGGEASATVARTDGELTITVSNTGPAIAEEIRLRLFEPFIGTNEESHGLGLWATRQIVRQLRGDITLDSREGLTRFVVTLPIGASS